MTPAELRAEAHTILAQAREREAAAYETLGAARGLDRQGHELLAQAARLEADDSGQEQLSPEQAAKVVGRSAATLYTWRRRGTGPRYLQVGGKITYLRADLESWLHSRRIGSTAERRDLEAAS